MSDYVSPSNQSSAEDENQSLLEELLVSLPAGERLRNLPIALRQKDLAHILFMADIYKQIINVPGYIAEFGVMWGRNINLFHCLRECFEAYNHTRHILGFDTFTGFVDVSDQDTAPTTAAMRHCIGDYSVPTGHDAVLANILDTQESISHLSHIKRSALIKGDVRTTLPSYLNENPHALFALCYLDLDLFEPTRDVLSAIKPRLVKGSVLVFDEVLNPDYPGETIALGEVFGDVALRRGPLSGWKTYFVVE